METIFYTAIETAPADSVLHAVGAASESLAAIIRHAHTRGYELVPFEGWTDAHAKTGQIQANTERINDLMETLEIRRGGIPGEYRYYPVIADMIPTRPMEDDEGLAIIRKFTS